MVESGPALLPQGDAASARPDGSSQMSPAATAGSRAGGELKSSSSWIGSPESGAETGETPDPSVAEA